MDPAFVGLQDLDHGADDQAGGVELTPALALAARELAKEIFVDPAQQVAGLLRYPEDVFGQVFVGIFGAFWLFGQQHLALQLKPVRDMLEKDQAKGDVLAIRRLHIAAQLVGRLDEVGLDAKVGAVVW